MIGGALGEQFLAQAEDQPLGVRLAMTAAQLQDNGIGPGRLSGQGRPPEYSSITRWTAFQSSAWWAPGQSCTLRSPRPVAGIPRGLQGAVILLVSGSGSAHGPG